MNKTYAIDFESFYSKDVAIGEQGIYHYLRHPESDIYLVSIAGCDGTRFVGHPKDAPWTEIMGPNSVWLSHNVGFDLPCYERLVELQQAPGNTILESWHDTADLTAFLGFPRSLKEASLYLLGLEISKDTRDKMKGKRWESMTPEFRAEVEQYALTDAENCLNIWLKHAHKWPEEERHISHMTREMAYRGVPLDKEALEEAKTKLEVTVWEAEALIPWAKEDKILSPIAIRAECLKVGIRCPKSLAQTDPEVQIWEEEYAEAYPWVKAVRSYRKADKHLKTVCTMLGRLRPDGTMAYGLKYFGAHTGRDSGDSGWNAQNLPSSEVCGVNLRALIKAPEGKTFVLCDLSQIEPRVLAWVAGDAAMLSLLAQGNDPYEAHARATMGYSDPRPLKDVDTGLRKVSKARVLGLGYKCGPTKFVTVAWNLARLLLTPAESERIVGEYRTANGLIRAVWRKMEALLRKTACTEGDHHAVLELPSGRKLTYRNVSSESKGLTALMPHGGKMLRLGVYDGRLTENLCQGIARDVFMAQCLDLASVGLAPCLRVHDEAVILVDEAAAESSLKQVTEIMSTAPEWAVGLPLAAEGKISKIYTK